MGYFNNQTGYPTDILSTRAIIKRGNYALIPPNGLVRNVIPVLKTATSPSCRRRNWVPPSSIIW